MASILFGQSYYLRFDPKLWQAMQRELIDGDPVVAVASNGARLAAGWQGMLAHAVLVYGLHDDRVYYLDPWDGRPYSMTVADFVAADTFGESSFLVVFEPAP